MATLGNVSLESLFALTQYPVEVHMKRYTCSMHQIMAVWSTCPENPSVRAKTQGFVAHTVQWFRRQVYCLIPPTQQTAVITRYLEFAKPTGYTDEQAKSALKIRRVAIPDVHDCPFLSQAAHSCSPECRTWLSNNVYPEVRLLPLFFFSTDHDAFAGSMGHTSGTSSAQGMRSAWSHSFTVA